MLSFLLLSNFFHFKVVSSKICKCLTHLNSIHGLFDDTPRERQPENELSDADIETSNVNQRALWISVKARKRNKRL